MTTEATHLLANRTLRCVAATAEGTDLSVCELDELGTQYEKQEDGNYYRSAEWYLKSEGEYWTTFLTWSRTPDGTCIITNSADNQVRTFIVYARMTL